MVPVSVTPKDTGLLQINVALADSGVKLFSAIPYNVKARNALLGYPEGLAVENLRSSTPGLFRVGEFDSALWTKPVSGGDTLPENASRLGGAAFRMMNLTADTADIAGFTVSFAYRAPLDPTQVEAFAWERAHAKWRRLVLVAGNDPLRPRLRASGSATRR